MVIQQVTFQSVYADLYQVFFPNGINNMFALAVVNSSSRSREQNKLFS